MKVMAPDYLPSFRCIAGECRHTCCEGWEIDIDEETLRRYREVPGVFGEKLRGHIDLNPEPHFRLLDGERCPLLREDGLCSMILEMGEESLCQICRDHPRFRNYWSDRIEIGLGMACEEAARLILTCDHSMRLICVGDEPDEEAEEADESEVSLRALRDELIRNIRETGPAGRLREYLIYRHIPDALYDGRLEARLQFIDRAFWEILQGFDGGNLPLLIERARTFSNEIEYDDEKLEAMISGAM
ncbi:MAG: flagellin lysine-N-methylase [Clostridia bacterium]|nr:flagellin lysine-N-methylase [Clostridia bacterium]